MDLRPFNVKNHRVKHIGLASLATSGSVSATTPGTGLQIIPIYFWGTASAIASVTISNGTSGTVMFLLKMPAGGIVEGRWWDDDSFLTNKPLVLESNDGIRVHNFHVWYTIRRVGAGAAGETL